MMVSTAYSDTTITGPEANSLEEKQLDDALTRPPVSFSDTDELLVRVGKLLKRNPDNRPARIMRTWLLAGSGRVIEASVDADYLHSKWPDDYKSNEARANLDRITGTRDGELAAYQAMAAAKPDNNPNAQRLREPAGVLHARIQELEGDESGAQKTWKDMASASPPGDSGIAAGYTEFLVRQGAYEDAADGYRKIILAEGKFPNQAGIVSSLAADRLSLASVLWASGKLSDAASQTDAVLTALKNWKDPRQRTND
jgi:hypothetical protein